jgi:hypothetical protein
MTPSPRTRTRTRTRKRLAYVYVYEYVYGARGEDAAQFYVVRDHNDAVA